MLSVLTTRRLAIDRFTPDDAPFILALLNDPGWLRFIGDRGVRTEDAARDYIVNGPMAMYAREGFGLWKVSLLETGEPIGMAGLIKRPTLDDVDLGFAFLPPWRGHGYAREAAEACIGYARDTLNLRRLVAIVSPDNTDSLKLLAALGFAHERELEMKPGDRVELHQRSL